MQTELSGISPSNGTLVKKQVAQAPQKFLRNIALALFFATAIPLALLQLYPQNNDIELWASSILVIPMLSLLLLRRVSFQAAAWMTIGSLWLAITLSIVRYSHANGMLEITYILLIFLASILLAGRRWMFVATASVLTSTVLAFAQLSGLLHVSQHTINEKWLLALFQIGTLAAVSAFIFWNRQREKAAIQAIQVQNIELEEQRNMMEQRSAELSTSSARLQLESQQRRQSMAKLRKAEAALRTSENRYRTVFEHDPNAIIIADLLTQKIVEANGSATRLFGYRQDVIQTLSMPALSPEEQPQWVNDDADLLAMDKATFHDLSVYEWVFQKADGEQFPAEVRMVRLPTIGNSGQLFQMSIVDITERHYALRALRESEARYRTLVENAPDAIVIIDAEAQCIVEANESAALLFGKSKIELLTADIREVLPLDSADTSYNTFAEIAEATKDGGTITVEFLHTDQAGEATTLEAHLVKMPANNRRLLRASMIDVTRRRNAEDMVSAIPGCVSVLSLDGDVLWANSAFIGRFELTATNLVGVSIKQFITAEEFAFMVAALRDQTGQRNFKFIAQSVQGAEMWLTTAATVIEFKHRAAILFFVEDAETPTPTLSETTPILDGVQISAEVAQQFQELIGAILNQSTIALSKLPQHNPARSHVEKSLAAAKQFANLGRNTIGEPKAAKISVTNIAVNTLLTDNDGLFALTIPPHLSIEYALEPALPEIHADLDLIKRMVAGLVINAADAIGNDPGLIVVQTGVVVISAENQAPYITHTGTLLKSGKYVKISVADNGNGYNSAALQRLFDPEQSSSGARLAAIVKVVRGHRGGLKVTSEEGNGSTFEVIFPAVRRAGQAKDRILNGEYRMTNIE